MREPMAETKGKQLPPVRVTDDAHEDVQGRAQACKLSLSEYIRYRVYGKKVLTGEQIENVKKQEKIVD